MAASDGRAIVLIRNDSSWRSDSRSSLSTVASCLWRTDVRSSRAALFKSAARLTCRSRIALSVAATSAASLPLSPTQMKVPLGSIPVSRSSRISPTTTCGAATENSIRIVRRQHLYRGSPVKPHDGAKPFSRRRALHGESVTKESHALCSRRIEELVIRRDNPILDVKRGEGWLERRVRHG